MDYSEIISKKAADIKPSGIRKFFDLLQTRKDVISLTVGEPDFVTPWHIRHAGIESLEDGRTYYTSNRGLLELRAEAAAYLERRFSLKYDAEKEIIVTVGGSEAIDLCIRALIEPGDEVIIPTPCFVCYEPLVTLAGGKPITIETKEKDNFKLKAEDLRSAITDKTKLLILPFPNNPTGAIMTEEDLCEIADVIRGSNIMILSDEIYAELTYGRKHVSIASLPDMKERTVLVSGFSKAYAMTGWRLGYLAAPKEIADIIFKIHQFGIMCSPTTSQYAAIEALRNGDGDIEEMKEEYDRRRVMILRALSDIGIDCFEPEGAFYVFPNISRYGLSSDEFCRRLLDDGVALVPGNAFGECGEGFVRISYAYSVKHIKAAMEKLKKFTDRLGKN